MVLHHVAQRARVVVVAAAGAHPHLLGDGDLHGVDVAAVPERLVDRVGEAEGEDVLHRLLAQVVVDAEDLRLVEQAAEEAVELLGAVEVVAEGLLEDQARALDVREAAAVVELFGDELHRRRGGREVEDARRRLARLGVEGVEVLAQAAEGRGVGEVGPAVFEVGGEDLPGPVLGLPLPAELVHPVARVLEVDGRVLLLDVEGDDLERLGERLVQPEVVEGRHQLAPGQVAAAAEDDESRRIGRFVPHARFSFS